MPRVRSADVNIKHKQRIKTETEWNASNVILLPGELGCTSDTNVIKVGDGISLWSELPAISGGTGDMSYDPANKRLVI